VTINNNRSINIETCRPDGGNLRGMHINWGLLSGVVTVWRVQSPGGYSRAPSWMVPSRQRLRSDTVVSWSCYNTIAARSVVERSPSQADCLEFVTELISGPNAGHRQLQIGTENSPDRSATGPTARYRSCTMRSTHVLQQQQQLLLLLLLLLLHCRHQCASAAAYSYYLTFAVCSLNVEWRHAHRTN